MPNHVLLQSIQLSATTTSITFANIPQTGFNDLKIVASTRTTGGNQGEVVNIAFNGSSSNITGRLVYIDYPNAVSTTTTSNGFWTNGGGATANTFSNSELYIPNYAGDTNKSWNTDSVLENNGGTYSLLLAGLWSQTTAISSITFTPGASQSFVANSTFSLYGIAASGTTPTIAPKATGGNTITTDGTYWYHAFLTSGTFTPLSSLSCDSLVIAGGAGGGGSRGGGGGAGGYRTASATISSALLVTVGAGGSGGTIATRGSNGSNSSFNSIISTGGGGGGGSSTAAATGGSGGGGFYEQTAGAAGNAGAFSPVEGYAGANAAGLTFGGVGNLPAGGGGGAGGIAPALTSNLYGGTGGPGSNAHSTWLSATRTGVSGYIAGGGGGAALNAGGNQGAGGSGGGGAASAASNTAGSAGTTNTGSGGGGGYGGSGGVGDASGGAGGSGIIIIRYAV